MKKAQLIAQMARRCPAPFRIGVDLSRVGYLPSRVHDHWLVTELSSDLYPRGILYNGNLYYLLSLNTWTGADADAVLLGGHLVTINDAAENAFVFRTFNSGFDRNRWIGLTDQASEDVFSWISGEPVGYLNWNTGEPNDCCSPSTPGQENYALIQSEAAFGGRWNDSADTTSFNNFGVAEVTQIESAPITEPATLSLLGVGCGVAAGLRGRRRERVSSRRRG